MFRLLIADTKRTFCDKVRNMLDWQHYGFTTIATATSYSEALDVAVDLRPHIALVSLQLGDYYGYVLAQQLRSAGIQTIFCILADKDEPAHMRKAMQAGARDYIVKPLKQGLTEFIERTITEDLHGTLPLHATIPQDTDPVLHLEYSQLSRVTCKILLYIAGNFRSSLSLTAIAEKFNMSSKYIGRVFLKDTGLRFTEYLMAYRMLEARRLIIGTQEKISVIAGMVGYTQLNNFYIHFKNYFGTSPSSLRHFDADESSENTTHKEP